MERKHTATALNHHAELVEALRRFINNEDYHAQGGRQDVYDTAYAEAVEGFRALLATIDQEAANG